MLRSFLLLTLLILPSALSQPTSIRPSTLPNDIIATEQLTLLANLADPLTLALDSSPIVMSTLRPSTKRAGMDDDLWLGASDSFPRSVLDTISGALGYRPSNKEAQNDRLDDTQSLAGDAQPSSDSVSNRTEEGSKEKSRFSGRRSRMRRYRPHP
ncbi:hypothetical protein CI109_103233 [Kwoniella shandongensis]|uniref:Uncharacterized protein n=1 Tax=Kwoniella shandongensis TaxID=1734106 RepID=A0A5M6CAI7_9TREE|nr:uncharacterized protein CI109_000423 [Kwoniella shandongensis]KAA5531580.1 hypothetical protein CI109_000423 [Kwoniella shandongensis]